MVLRQNQPPQPQPQPTTTTTTSSSLSQASLVTKNRHGLRKEDEAAAATTTTTTTTKHVELDDETNTDTEEDDDNEEEDEDDEEEENASWISEVLDGWKQHCVAILVAILATAVAVFYQQQQQHYHHHHHHPPQSHPYYSSPSPPPPPPSSLLTWSCSPTLSFVSRFVFGGPFGSRDPPPHPNHPTRPSAEKPKHAYLNDYARTANLSFCGETMPRVPLSLLSWDNDNGHHPSSSPGSTTTMTPAELLPMEFNVPKSSLIALKAHYLVDWLALQQQQGNSNHHYNHNEEEEENRRLTMAWHQLQQKQQPQPQPQPQQPPDRRDHHYNDLGSSSSSSSTDESAVVVSPMATKLRAQFQCLLALERESPKSYIKGLTYYYPSPTIASMYLPPKQNEQQQEQESSSLSILETAASALPPVSSSSSSSPRLQPAVLTFTGFAVKFVNLSPRPVLLYWEGKRQEDQRLLGEIAPMESLGTATSTPGHSFFVTPVYDSSHALQRWVVTADDCVLYYEPENMLEMLMLQQQQEQKSDKNQNHQQSSATKLLALYTMQKLNQEFARHYLIASGRTWLANFPRPFPLHFMHPAPYIGHVQRISWPLLDGRKENQGIAMHNDTQSDATVSSPRLFTTMTTNNNNSNSTTTNTTAKTIPTYRRMIVESVSPRVFSIPNFLSKEECEQLIQLALSQGMNQSTVFAGGSRGYYSSNDNHHADGESKPNNFQHDSTTRSSSNTWLPRQAANLTNVIYRRAAHLLQLDETLLQGDWIHDDLQASYHSIAESLQIVRYRPGERYAPHHDFVYPPPQSRWQPTRFATLLLYLNDNFQGGQTVFPRAVNAHYHEGITMQPQQGMAVLFYNVLPDGNVDDLSQHQSEPVTEGIKYLANLWIWEPVIN